MSSQIYVGKIKGVSNKDVIEFFSQYGTITKSFFPRVRVDKDHSYRKSFCFITYQTEEDAKEALGASGLKINEIEIAVEAATPRPPRKEIIRPKPAEKSAQPQQAQGTEAPVQQTRPERVQVEIPSEIIITELPVNLCVRQIIPLFEGPIRSVIVNKPRHGKETSDAIIKFHEEKDAKAALDKKTVKIEDKEYEIFPRTAMRTKTSEK